MSVLGGAGGGGENSINIYRELTDGVGCAL